ncbi:protein kinase [Nonomuraea phyllanthi]|uniref:Protein kinase n=1 Tax=Nonomuraea phyllanthi TaxID=2219224 RepID=A0A5C4WR10_9ACTN|nr:WD40 repeat domain-containing serine/threonine protein kinase [Nonomuraea phyllanthi]KAB8195459.1 protein kinase [Nonomuraea phyllanthi]QFY10407.1 protein kinase [Nonomuraea phyllanthi]
MPYFTPLMPGDPEELGGLELVGKLGEGGQGVVYLARTPMGAHMAIKWLRHEQSDDPQSVERFLREAQVAQQVAPFCIAAVLSTGVEHGRPYIMSEYVEGPSLDQVVRNDGPRTGPALDRLAIGTATALAAIHEADVVHRDFKPGNVIIAADGPRVIDFGIARTLGPVPMTSSTQIGTPAYMSPEQIMGRAVGPAADMFSWAATMVFASCGRAPFGSDGTHAVMSRVLREPPDLGALEGPLREVVSQCLAKDPEQRPAAKEVIMRLLHNPPAGSDLLAEGTRRASPRTPATPPPPGRAPARTPFLGRKPVLAAGGVLVALLLVATGMVIARVLPGRPVAGGPTGSASATPEQPTRPPRTTAAPKPVKTTLPGGKLTLYEYPSAQATLTAYEIYDKGSDSYVDYARQSLGGTFDKYSDNLESRVSPDGRYLASRPKDYTSDDYDSVLITDRAAGSSFRVRTVRKPLDSSVRAWTKDSSKILLNINKQIKDKKGKEDWVTLGFAIVTVARNDIAKSEVSVVEVSDDSIGDHEFGWDAEEEGVVVVYGEDKGLRFFDAAGKPVRDVPGVGPIPYNRADIFSPSGRTFVTDCPDGGDGEHCLWDSATGKQIRTFTSDCDTVLGWYDETHLYCWERDNTDDVELRVVGFDGKLVRRLMVVPDGMNVRVHLTVNSPSTS